MALIDDPALPRVGTVELAQQRLLAALHAGLGFLCGEHPASLRPLVGGALAHKGCLLELHVGGCGPLTLWIDDVESITPGLPLPLHELPPDFHALALAESWRGWLQATGQWLGAPLTLRGVRADIRAPADGFDAAEQAASIDWQLETGAPRLHVEGRLRAGHPVLTRLAERLESLGQPPVQRRHGRFLLNLSLSPEPITLRLDEWTSLVPGDVVLCGEDTALPDGPAVLRLSCGEAWLAGWQLRRTETTWKLERCPMIQPPVQDRAVWTDAVTCAPGELALRVDLDLGHLTISVDELLRLRPGQVFDLPASVGDAKVHLRIAGRPLGTGQLVSVAGQLGVRIVDLLPPPPRPADADAPANADHV